MSHAFNRALGTDQGRVVPKGAVAHSGSYAFVLGFGSPGRVEAIEPGDYVQVAQVASFAAGTKLLRVAATIRPPSAPVPAGLWRLHLLIDGLARATHDLVPGAKMRTLELAANVSKLAAGNHTIALRLELVP